MEHDDAYLDVYEFEWDDGTSRRTDNIEGDIMQEEIDTLVHCGKQDPECKVTQIGWEKI